MEFSHRLKVLRQERGLIQSELAKTLGLSVQTISAYENGRDPNYETLCKIADYFQVSINYMLGLSECKTIENEGVAKQTRLTENAIEKIAQVDDTAIKLLSLLIESPKFDRLITALKLYFGPSQIQRHAGAYIEFSDKEITQEEAYKFALMSCENLAGDCFRELIKDIRSARKDEL